MQPGDHRHRLANERSLALRPPVRLTVEQAAKARDLRRQSPGMTITAIARRIGAKDPEAVTRALATLRTPLPRPRSVVNCSEAAKVFVRTQAQPGESAGACLDRLLAELVQLRG